MKTNELTVVYEDNHLIVVVKEANVPTQEDESQDDDMLNLVKQYIKEKYQKPGDVYLGLLHRLDRRVGGLMVFARTSKAASRMSEIIRKREFQKEYTAIVVGKIPASGQLIDYLSKIEKNGPHAIITDSFSGQEAVLEYETKKTFIIDAKTYSVVHIRLITGRYNQIRIQVANFGHPVINDFKYGYQGNNFNDQLGLVCSGLGFIHPVTKEFMNFNYLPKDGIWEYLGRNYHE
jgi:23S rRNA pseudouridine1911/1915/1917 synthase